MSAIRLICISNNSNFYSLTVGKEYYGYMECSWYNATFYRLFNDKGDENSYPATFFMTVKEYRYWRFEEIGI